MTPEQFVEKWANTKLTERAASHEHFIDLCRILGVPTPAEADPEGKDYCFDKAVQVISPASKGSKGDSGFVDVWKRGCFGWEYKRKDRYKDLSEAYRQLYQYGDALDNPPLAVVCDINQIQIHTHFTGYPRKIEVVTLTELPSKLNTLRRVFTAPYTFKPFKTRDAVTADAANEFGQLADRLIDRHTAGRHEAGAQTIAHYLMKLMFCLFAEHAQLLPAKAFTRLINLCVMAPEEFEQRAGKLFTLMRTGGEFGNDIIPWFNGGLFDEQPAIALKHGDLLVLQRIAQLDWSGVEPSIFGTLFQRILDPNKRAQIGAHFTGREDILLVIQPVIMQPLQRQWAALQAELAPDLKTYADLPPAKRTPAARKLEARLDAFREGLGKLRVLDSACGSGNFLYVALQQLLELNEQVVIFAKRHGLELRPLPWIKPTQMHGIEINPYAAELAQVVIWIGYLQWLKDRGLDIPNQPILDKLECIENRDAILDLSDPKNPVPAKWPEADFIVGNPPFLGSKLFRRSGLSDEYVNAMYAAFDLPRTSDLCCYWFELARRQIEKHTQTRAGLLATQGIRGGDNRTVLERIKNAGDIFMAWSDRDWILDGAAVHVSIIGFDHGHQTDIALDGIAATKINADLTSGAATIDAARLAENAGLAFMGDTKGGSFDINLGKARQLLSHPNPSGCSNTGVVRRWINGLDITRRDRSMFIVDFGCAMAREQAAAFEAPFRHVETQVWPERKGNRRSTYAQRWWLHVEPRPAMRAAVPKDRYIGTPSLTKYRFFVFVDGEILPDHQLFAFARNDDYFLGVLHSALHELWTLRTGSQLEDRPRYTPSSCFETFPFPWAPGKEPVKDTRYHQIAAVAKEFNDLRERWLNPPEWLQPLADRIDATDKFEDVPAEARALVRQSALMAAAAEDARLKKRTLTNLYNERPTWLKLAHEKLDRAVLAAYAATDPAGQWDESFAEVFTDTGPGQPLPAGHPLLAQRAQVERTVLENLLRLNLARVRKTETER